MNSLNKTIMLFEDCVMHGESLYFYAYEYNMLCSMDIKSGETNYISSIPNEPIISNRLIGKIEYYDKKLYLMPMRISSNYLWIFNLENNEMEKIELQAELPNPPYEKFSYMKVYGNKLFLVGCYFNGIIIIDLENNKQKIIENIYPYNNRLYATSGCLAVENMLIVPLAYTNKVIKIDMNTEKSEIVCVGDSSCSYSGVEYRNGFFWLAPYKKTHVIKWDGASDFVMYDLPDEYMKEGDKYLFNGIRFVDRYILVNGLEGISSFQFEENNYKDAICCKESYLLIKTFDDNDYLLQKFDGELIGKIDETEIRVTPQIENDCIAACFRRLSDNSALVLDEKKLDLDSFIKIIE